MAEGDEVATTFTQAQVDEVVAGLKRKNDELLGNMKQLKDSLEPLKGLDPDKARAALAAQERAEAEKQKLAGDWEAREKAIREQAAKEHAEIVGPMKSELESLRGGLFKAVAVRDALEAMGKPDIKGNSALLLPLLEAELGVEVVDGRQVTVVKGPDGKPRYRTTDNTLLSVEDRLKELRARPEYGGAFMGTGSSGTGAEGGRSAPGQKAVAAGDNKAFLANLGGIAKGEVAVTP